MLQNSSEFNNVGQGLGMPGGFGFGGGGFSPFGLFGLIGLLGRRGFGEGGDDNCAKEAAVLAAIANAKDTTVAEGRGVLAAIANSKDTTVAEGRSLAAAICDAEKTNLQQFYAAAIQASNNTQAIKDQATAFAIVNDKRFDDLAAAGVAQTAAIIAKLNQSEIDSLRDQLHGEKRRGDNREIEISIQNSNAQAQSQLQTQLQTQRDEFKNLFAVLSAQVNKTSNDVINFGTMAASGNQANQQTNVK